MMNQRDALPDKTLVKVTKSKLVRQNQSTLLQKSKKHPRKVDRTGERGYCRGEGERYI